jgi:asparagine synthase (glutamine-hydrolysing)
MQAVFLRRKALSQDVGSRLMCGFVAFLGREKIDDNHPSISSVNHRGPDASGARSFVVGDLILSLAHRRLSILDLEERGNQPFSSTAGGPWVVYNGEIYNYLEIRLELEKEGYVFRTNTDTEVLVQSYVRWGLNCIEKFNGMFSFVIWDAKKRCLVIVRDRFGIKPLYLWNDPTGLAVCSEIKQLCGIPGFKGALDLEIAHQYLCYGDFSIGPNTLWKDVIEVEPGTLLVIETDKYRPGQDLVPVRWYEIARREKSTVVTEPDAVAEFSRLLEDAIRIRLRADVPVTVALSGGHTSNHR